MPNMARPHYSDAGTLNHHAFELVWATASAVPVVVSGEIDETENPPAIQLLGNPVVVTPDVRVFDPLTGQTVDVVQISGGNPSLRPEKVKTRRRTSSGLVRLVPRLNLQLQRRIYRYGFAQLCLFAARSQRGGDARFPRPLRAGREWRSDDDRPASGKFPRLWPERRTGMAWRAAAIRGRTCLIASVSL